MVMCARIWIVVYTRESPTSMAINDSSLSWTTENEKENQIHIGIIIILVHCDVIKTPCMGKMLEENSKKLKNANEAEKLGH